MPTTNLEGVKDTIRKLLRLAENDAATEGEIDNALRFAHRLMTRHFLTREDIGDLNQDCHVREADLESIQMAKEQVCAQATNLCTWECALSRFVCDLLRSVQFYRSHKQPALTAAGVIKTKNGKPVVHERMIFYGPAEEVAVATEMYNELATTIATMARLKTGSAIRGKGRCYGDGFVQGLCDQLGKVDSEERNSTGRDLVLRSTVIATQLRSNAKNWLAEKYGVHLCRGRGFSTSTHDWSAYAAGREDGQRTEIRQNRPKKLK